MGICYDGMLSEEYKTAPLKIVWVLKEALCEGYLGKQLDNAINKKQANPTWQTMAYAAYAVLTGWASGSFSKWEKVPTVDNGVLKFLRKVAVVNVKKEACIAKNGLSDNTEIWGSYKRECDLINQQITRLAPDIVVFGYPEMLRGIVEEVFKTQTGGKEYLIEKHFGDFASTVAEANGRRCLFLWGYHPGYYHSEETGDHSQYNYFTAFVDAVREFRGMK